MTAKQHLIHVLGNIVRMGGQVTTEEHAAERLKICLGCPLYGMVEPLPEMVTEGCTKCGCPAQEKTRTLTVRSGIRKFKLETCPHPEGNKWQDVDKQFEQQYKNR